MEFTNCIQCTAPHIYSQLRHKLVGNASAQQDQSVAQYCILLPGKTLHISALLAAKRFQDRGNKEGTVKAIQEAGLGTVIENKPTRGASTVCAQEM